MTERKLNVDKLSTIRMRAYCAGGDKEEEGEVDVGKQKLGYLTGIERYG